MPRDKHQNHPTTIDKYEIPLRKTVLHLLPDFPSLVVVGESSAMRFSHILSCLPLLSSARAATFTSCTAAQISTLEVAIDRATNKSYAAIEHLEANPNGSEIQTTWYGAFGTERYNRVLTAFKVRDVIGRLVKRATETTAPEICARPGDNIQL